MAESAETSSRKRKHDSQKGGGDHSKRKKKRSDSDHAPQQDLVKHIVAIDHLATLENGSQEDSSSWTVSEPIGGKFIDRDPIFSQDEKLLVFATEYSVNTYSTSTSLLVQSLHSNDGGAITDYALSSIDPNILWVSTIEGHLLRWNLESGKLLDSWQHTASIQNLSTVADPDAKAETIFTVDPATEGYKVTAHAAGGAGLSASEQLTVLESQAPISAIKTLDSGNIVAVTTLDSVILGTASPGSQSSRHDRQYTWREIKCKEAPVCFDMRLQTKNQQHENSKKAKGAPAVKTNSVSLVIGGVKGCIYVYEDVFNRLERIENPSKVVEESTSFTGKALHWHREAVGAVAWSKDGNYIISGGKETVLVLWQLETGRKQFLPNLESPVQSIVVSPSASSYAVRLGDNSVMVLSTSELSPTSYVASLQTPSFSKVTRPEPSVLTVESASQHEKTPALNRVAAVINPASPSQFLAPVPAYQTARGANTEHSSASYIQSFDLSTSRHESRQAMARTNAINSNLGPEGNRILEPEVKFVQISSNGKWLATVDEWAAPARDVAKLSAPGDSRIELNESRLRFWSWDAIDKSWALNTRIEDPHNDYDDDTHSQRILDLASDPVTTKFATLGTDCVVRVWMPRSAKLMGKSTLPNGKTEDRPWPVAGETWWTLQHCIPLEKSLSEDPLFSVSPTRALLCYSNDASVLAAYQFFKHDPAQGAIYLIDVGNGVLREIQRNLVGDGDELSGMAFLERYLICVGRDAALVWDMTSFDMHAHIPLKSKSSQEMQLHDERHQENKKKRHRKKQPQHLLTHLAVNTSTTTFAIAVPEPIPNKTNIAAAQALLNHQTRLSIFSPEHGDKPIFSAVLPRPTSALLSAGVPRLDGARHAAGTGQGKGYVVLDTGAEARIIAPAGTKPNTHGIVSNGDVLALQRMERPPVEAGADESEPLEDEDLSEDESQDAVSKVTRALAAAMVKEEEYSRRVVRDDELAELFDHPSHVMPTMKELFQGVLTLYAEKPREAMQISEGHPKAARGHKDDSDEELSEAESDMDSSSDED